MLNCESKHRSISLQQKAAGYSTPYKFTRKELDAEIYAVVENIGTGLYYFGARYYDPSLGIFHGVDAMAGKHPNMSPFVYTANNPIRYIDPDGNDWYENNQTGSFKWFDDDQCREGFKHIGKTHNYMSVNGPVDLHDNNEWNYSNSKNNVPWVRDDYSPNSNLWNSPIMRLLIPDRVGINISVTGLGNAGAAISYNADWITRGHDASLKPYISKTKSALFSVAHLSFDLGLTGTLGEYATMDIRSLKKGGAADAILGMDYSYTLKETPGVGASYTFGAGFDEKTRAPNWLTVAKAGGSVGFSGGIGYGGINVTTPIYGTFSAFKK
jgi:RHS repeat-associated protein